jgi:2-C-methyl-D-erythritol 4-phosphate cytidylyltransferase
VPPGGPAAAVVLAGGSGTRVGAEANKVYLPLAGRPLVAWTLRAFAAVPAVHRLVLVVRPADRTLAEAAVAGVPVEIVDGGSTRHGSEWAALRHLAPAIRAGDLAVVAVHDGARPLVGPDLIAATIDAARVHGAAVPGLPLPDAAVLSPGLQMVPPERRLVRVQTPQAFAADPLLTAYERAERDGFGGTDTASCVERYGGPPVHCLPGDPRNLKVTFPRDLLLAEKLLRAAGGTVSG